MTGLISVFYQDLRYRAVYWWCFPVIFVLLLVLTRENADWHSVVANSLYNVAFLLLQLVVLTVYFSFRQRKLVIITKGLLGWGDILLLLCLAFYFSPLTYLLFYVSSLIIVLLFTLLIRLKDKEAGMKVPLAGLQALLFAILLVADWNSSFINTASDDWLLYLIP